MWSSGYRYWLQYQTRNFQTVGLNLTRGHLQAKLSKLVTYSVLRSTRPLIFTGREMSSSLQATAECLVRLIKAVERLCAAPRVQLFVNAGSGWPHDVQAVLCSGRGQIHLLLPRFKS